MAERDLSRHERAPRGGADTWDLGPAGELLTAEFFGATPASGSAVATSSGTSTADAVGAAIRAAAGSATGTGAAAGAAPVGLRLDAVGDALKLATPQSSPTGITMLAWVRLQVDRNNYSAVFTLENAGATQYNELVTDADGTTLAIYDHGTGRLATVGTLVVGTWHKVALVITSGAFAAYFGTEGVAGVSKVTGSIANLSAAPALQHVGSSLADEWLNGTFSGVRVWDAALSDAEVAEFTQRDVPRRPTSTATACPHHRRGHRAQRRHRRRPR